MFLHLQIKLDQEYLAEIITRISDQTRLDISVTWLVGSTRSGVVVGQAAWFHDLSA